MPSNYERLLQYALWLISKKRYTVLEIRKKLKQFLKKHEIEESGEDDFGRVIDRLLELDYLNDENYAKDYVNDRIKLRPRGKFLLKRELKLKGIPPELISSTVDDLEIDELPLAMELIRKKRFDFSDDRSGKEKARAYRFLASKGFEKEIIYKACQSTYNPS